jgi:hypothetical protein
MSKTQTAKTVTEKLEGLIPLLRQDPSDPYRYLGWLTAAQLSAVARFTGATWTLEDGYQTIRGTLERPGNIVGTWVARRAYRNAGSLVITYTQPQEEEQA